MTDIDAESAPARLAALIRAHDAARIRALAPGLEALVPVDGVRLESVLAFAAVHGDPDTLCAVLERRGRAAEEEEGLWRAERLPSGGTTAPRRMRGLLEGLFAELEDDPPRLLAALACFRAHGIRLSANALVVLLCDSFQWRFDDATCAALLAAADPEARLRALVRLEMAHALPPLRHRLRAVPGLRAVLAEGGSLPHLLAEQPAACACGECLAWVRALGHSAFRRDAQGRLPLECAQTRDTRRALRRLMLGETERAGEAARVLLLARRRAATVWAKLPLELCQALLRGALERGAFA